MKREFKKLKREEYEYRPPKPKHSIEEIMEKANEKNMSYGKYVSLIYQKGYKL